jgi:hypothetical protein
VVIVQVIRKRAQSILEKPMTLLAFHSSTACAQPGLEQPFADPAHGFGGVPLLAQDDHAVACCQRRAYELLYYKRWHRLGVIAPLALLARAHTFRVVVG